MNLLKEDPSINLQGTKIWEAVTNTFNKQNAIKCEHAAFFDTFAPPEDIIEVPAWG